MECTALWIRESGTAKLSCLYIVAWETLSKADFIGAVGGRLTDGSCTLIRFYLKLDAEGAVKHLVVGDKELKTGRIIGFDKLDQRILAAAKSATELILSKHESFDWENGRSLYLRADLEATLQERPNGALGIGNSLDELMIQVVTASGVTSMAPAESIPTPPIHVATSGADGASMNCPSCGMGNSSASKFCVECGTKLSDEVEQEESHAEVAQTSLAIASSALSPMELGIESCSLEGPDDQGEYSANVSVECKNTTSQNWARIELVCTLHNANRTPLQSYSNDMYGIAPSESDSVGSYFGGIAAARLGGNLQKMCVTVAATAYAEHTQQFAEVTIRYPSTTVSMGGITIPEFLVVVDAGFNLRAADADNQVILESYCLIQNISSTYLPYVEFSTNLVGANTEYQLSGFATAIKPGHIELIDCQEWIDASAAEELTAHSLVKAFTPVSFGSIQCQEVSVERIERPDDDGDGDADEDEDDEIVERLSQEETLELAKDDDWERLFSSLYSGRSAIDDDLLKVLFGEYKRVDLPEQTKGLAQLIDAVSDNIELTEMTERLKVGPFCNDVYCRCIHIAHENQVMGGSTERRVFMIAFQAATIALMLVREFNEKNEQTKLSAIFRDDRRNEVAEDCRYFDEYMDDLQLSESDDDEGSESGWRAVAAEDETVSDGAAVFGLIFSLHEVSGDLVAKAIADLCRRLLESVEERFGAHSNVHLLSAHGFHPPETSISFFRRLLETGDPELEEEIQGFVGADNANGDNNFEDLVVTVAVVTDRSYPWTDEFLGISEDLTEYAAYFEAIGKHKYYEGLVRQKYQDGELDTGIISATDDEKDAYRLDADGENLFSEDDLDPATYYEGPGNEDDADDDNNSELLEPTGYRYFRGTVARIPENWTIETNEDDNGLIGVGLAPLDDDNSAERVVFRCFMSPQEFRWEVECAGNVEGDSCPLEDSYVGMSMMGLAISNLLHAGNTTLQRDLRTLNQAFIAGGDEPYGVVSELDEDQWNADISSEDAINLSDDERSSSAAGGFVVEIYPDCDIPEETFAEGVDAIEYHYQDNRDMDRHFFGVRFLEIVDDEEDEDDDEIEDEDETSDLTDENSEGEKTMAKNHITCPDGFSGLVLLAINDSDCSIQVFMPEENEPLEDDGDFFHNMTEDGSSTGIDIPEYLNGIGSRIFDFDLDKDDAAELISRRLSELKYLQAGGFIQEDVAFEIRDERS